jgi:hypothetical protein
MMNFSEQPPSKQWGALKYKGEKLAEVWFKPDGEPFALLFRIPQQTLQARGPGPRLTLDNILKSVGIAAKEVESWRLGECSDFSMSESRPEFSAPLPPPPPNTTHLTIYVALKPVPRLVAAGESGTPGFSSANASGTEGGEAEIPSPSWEDLETRWNTLLGVEANIETLRLTLEAVRVELEGLCRMTLTPEERLYARRDDVTRWDREKKRVYFVVPKLKEFVHRATWAPGVPERKELDELFKNSDRPDLPRTQKIHVRDQLGVLLKDRQVLSAQGVTVHQECKSIAANIQESLRTLQSNAAANQARKKRGMCGGKFFKDVRKLSGLE